LAQAGEEVVFIARGEHLRAIQANGLRVDSIKGDFTLPTVQATDEIKTLEPVEMILTAVKAWQVPDVAEQMKPLVKGDTGVIYLGNGVEAPDQLAAALGKEHVLGGLTRVSAAIAGPGHIRHVGIEPYIAFNELDGRKSERVERLRGAFLKATGVTVATPDDILAAIWEKFIFIAAISGVGAVTRSPAGVLRSQPAVRALLQGAIEEVTAVARARGVGVAADIVERTLAFIDSMGPAVTASMQRDIMDGRPSELEAQNGAVVRLGAQAGVATPVNAFLYAALLPQEMKARGQLTY
jgi:2-dehydropantoate 2-reductase